MNIEYKMRVVKDSINRIINIAYGVYEDGVINEIFDLEDPDITRDDRFTSWSGIYKIMINAVSEVIRQSSSNPINSELDAVKIKTAVTEKIHGLIPGMEYKYSVAILPSYSLGIFDLNWFPNTAASYVKKILDMISPKDEDGCYDINISYDNIVEFNKYSDEELKLYFKFK